MCRSILEIILQDAAEAWHSVVYIVAINRSAPTIDRVNDLVLVSRMMHAITASWRGGVFKFSTPCHDEFNKCCL